MYLRKVVLQFFIAKCFTKSLLFKTGSIPLNRKKVYSPHFYSSVLINASGRTSIIDEGGKNDC